ncbi:MAG: hypothetical protein ACK59C_01340 [Holosporales bacterium]|jgi:hypothetical protein
MSDNNSLSQEGQWFIKDLEARLRLEQTLNKVTDPAALATTANRFLTNYDEDGSTQEFLEAIKQEYPLMFELMHRMRDDRER